MVTKLVLPSDVEQLLRDLVEEGIYPDTDSAIRDAFAVLHSRQSREQLWRKLDDAERAITAGHGVELNDETKLRIADNARRRFEVGESPNPDVLPN